MVGQCVFDAPDMETMDVVLNSEGFWDDEFPPSNATRQKRILFLGDSFTSGFATQRRHRFSDLIKEKINDGFQVLNMGLWGYGLDQELLVLREKGLKYSSDVVVLSLFMDDIFTVNLFSVNAGLYIKPRFSLSENGTLKLGNVPVPNNHGKSYLFNMIISRIQLFRNRLALGSEYYQRGWLSVFDTKFLREKGFGLPLRLIQEMHGLLSTRNSKLVLVIIPYVDQLLDQEIYASGKPYMGIPPERLDLRLPQKVVKLFCEKSEIPVLDLLPVFKKQGAQEKLFFDKDLHWTKAGHRLASEEILRFLKTIGYIQLQT
jgi:hypothetical protein